MEENYLQVCNINFIQLVDLFVCVGVKMFFVSGQGGVTTLSQPQTLQAFQFVNYKPGTVMQFTSKKKCRNQQTHGLFKIIAEHHG